jgi:7-cyano-7-deazaguanine reductase
VSTLSDSPLGKPTRYPEAYDPALLHAVDRAPQRDSLGIGAALPFRGEDRWTAWEAAWLDGEGRPRVGIATFAVPCTSPRLVESKSVKLYVASLNHERIDSVDAVETMLRRDLSHATGADVDVRIDVPARWARHDRRGPTGEAIDDVVPLAFPATPDAALLRSGTGSVDETLVFHGFRSVCPITGQPDHASVRLAYRGAAIARASLCAYLIGYRRDPGFHEHCVERMFVDVLQRCTPQALCVEARFTRRGGLDINPVRATDQSLIVASGPDFRQ